MNRINYDRAVVNNGNHRKIKALMNRAASGDKITLGFIGGSITQGCLATEHENCYAYRVYKWWERKFPSADFTYINAGIGGTCSQFGVARAGADLLSHNPDFVITEFSVNDENTSHYKESYEGLIRKIVSYESKPAVLIVHNVFYNDGKNAEDMHRQIGEHYDIPCVSMKNTIYKAVEAGLIANREITDDDLHPNDLGHEMVASVIISFLEKIYEQVAVTGKNMLEMADEELPKTLQNPVTKNRFEKSVRYRNMDIKPVMNGFEIDNTIQTDLTDCFRYGWQGNDEGASIEFNLKCTGIALQYRRYAFKKAPKGRVVIDGDESNFTVIDGNFDETWGDKLELTNIAMDLDADEHNIRITLESCENAEVPFYLVSIIAW